MFKLKRVIGRSRLYQYIIGSFLFNEIVTLVKYARYKPVSNMPLGHFYSPVVSKNEIAELKKIIWEEESLQVLPGINLNQNNQLLLLEEWYQYYKEIPFQEHENTLTRYFYENVSFGYNDAIALYSMIRHYQPSKIIEIGSGYSSAVMLDTRELFKINYELIFIEPFPKSLYSRFRNSDASNCTVYESKVQKVELNVFSQLKKNDILFIDSSHVSKTGSDVNYEIFRILPSLNPGVIIHFHDVFYPFEYPESWVLNGYNWNEDYLLRAFLSYNDAFEILLFSDYLHKHHAGAFDKMPLMRKNTGGSIWLRKK